MGNANTSEILKCAVCGKATSDYIYFARSGKKIEIAHCKDHLSNVEYMKGMIAAHLNFLDSEIKRVNK